MIGRAAQELRTMGRPPSLARGLDMEAGSPWLRWLWAGLTYAGLGLTTLTWVPVLSGGDRQRLPGQARPHQGQGARPQRLRPSEGGQLR